MTDPDLILKKLAFIETCVAELERFAKPELMRADVKEERFITYTLQIAIQAALDVASHLGDLLRCCSQVRMRLAQEQN